MDVGSSSTATALVTAPQNVAKLTCPPYRKRPKNAALNDPTLEQLMGSKEKALDVEEFPEDSPLHLDSEDRTHWTRIRKALFNEEKAGQATKHTNPRSFGSNLAHARQTLRMLQDVSAGTRDKFGISGCAPRKASTGLKAKATKPKTNGIAKAKRAKSTKARDNWPSQIDTNMIIPSLSAATRDDATDAMDFTPADAVLDSVEDMAFETSEQGAENDQTMRQMAIDIRDEHPALRDITPNTMARITNLVEMGLWFPSQ
ncbi:MAG: hypothetical protein ASARMPREDX12_007593 [Alectoria sarmentosa]|nr:MAG: hypothetical protein ASARMPREDX12_007593 [Alectoria sarmentosa]